MPCVGLPTYTRRNTVDWDQPTMHANRKLPPHWMRMRNGPHSRQGSRRRRKSQCKSNQKKTPASMLVIRNIAVCSQIVLNEGRPTKQPIFQHRLWQGDRCMPLERQGLNRPTIAENLQISQTKEIIRPNRHTSDINQSVKNKFKAYFFIFYNKSDKKLTFFLFNWNRQKYYKKYRPPYCLKMQEARWLAAGISAELCQPIRSSDTKDFVNHRSHVYSTHTASITCSTRA